MPSRNLDLVEEKQPLGGQGMTDKLTLLVIFCIIIAYFGGGLLGAAAERTKTAKACPVYEVYLPQVNSKLTFQEFNRNFTFVRCGYYYEHPLDFNITFKLPFDYTTHDVKYTQKTSIGGSTLLQIISAESIRPFVSRENLFNLSVELTGLPYANELECYFSYPTLKYTQTNYYNSTYRENITKYCEGYDYTDWMSITDCMADRCARVSSWREFEIPQDLGKLDYELRKMEYCIRGIGGIE